MHADTCMSAAGMENSFVIESIALWHTTFPSYSLPATHLLPSSSCGECCGRLLLQSVWSMYFCIGCFGNASIYTSWHVIGISPLSLHLLRFKQLFKLPENIRFTGFTRARLTVRQARACIDSSQTGVNYCWRCSLEPPLISLYFASRHLDIFVIF